MNEIGFVIGERVIIRSSAGAGSYRYTFDTIARDTATRWITRDHGWFDKERLQGPRPKSDFATPDTLLKASDAIALRGMWTDKLRSRVHSLDQVVRRERTVSVGEARRALAAVEEALKQLEGIDA